MDFSKWNNDFMNIQNMINKYNNQNLQIKNRIKNNLKEINKYETKIKSSKNNIEKNMNKTMIEIIKNENKFLSSLIDENLEAKEQTTENK